jgi:hypothetical protein
MFKKLNETNASNMGHRRPTGWLVKGLLQSFHRDRQRRAKKDLRASGCKTTDEGRSESLLPGPVGSMQQANPRIRNRIFWQTGSLFQRNANQ